MKLAIINKKSSIIPLTLPLRIDTYVVYVKESEAKPVNPPNDCILFETDSGRVFTSLGGIWQCIVTKTTVSVIEPPVQGRQINDQWIQILE